MKYLDEFRDAAVVKQLARRIREQAANPWAIMEVCGGQTHSIVKFGVDQLLPKGIELLHGPGCPVCVTPLEVIDRAHALASQPEVIFCSFGDMLRVPGSRGDLLSVKSKGGQVRVVYSPLDAVEIAARNPASQVVFFAIGFETTAPVNALAILQARRRGLKNFTALVSHVLVPPVLRCLLQSPDNRVQAFLGPGHVCTVMGVREYEDLCREFRVPIVITGFEPVDLLEGILKTVEQLESGRAEMENQYARAVRPEGNPGSLAMIREVFEVCDRKWRGMGEIPASGYRIQPALADFDAERRFSLHGIQASEPAVCISGQILKGLKKPLDCPAFGRQCRPENPLGATMVSSEGACAAYYAYGRGLARSSSQDAAVVA